MAIALDGLDLDSLSDFAYATYRGGKRWYEAAESEHMRLGDRPTDGLVSFIEEFLCSRESRLVIVPNWRIRRTDVEGRKFQSQIAFHHNEVYHFLQSGDHPAEVIEATFCEPWHRWFTGVCADEAHIPSDYELTDEFLDELIDRTCHIFSPAFDCEGFVIWSPGSE